MKNISLSALFSVKALRFLGFLEGLSYLLLFFVTMPLKYLYDHGLANRIVGMAHGILFVAFILVCLGLYSRQVLTKNATTWSLISSLVPFGTFIADHKLWKSLRDKS